MNNVKNITLVFSVFFCTAIGLAQNAQEKIDSLKSVLKIEKSIDSIIAINLDIATQQMSNQSIDEASKTLHNLIKYSTEHRREVGAAKASLLMGRIFVAYKQQNDSAIYYDDNAIKILKNSDSKLELIRAYLNKARIYEAQSNFKNQLKNAMLAFEEAKKIKDNHQISLCATFLTSYYYTQEKFEEALKYGKYSHKYALLSNEKNRLIEAEFMLAEVYKSMADTVQANIHFQKSYTLAKQANNKFILAALLPDWADISDDKKALEMRLETEEILNSSDGSSQQTHNKGLLGILYFGMFKKENNALQKREYFEKAERYLMASRANADDQDDFDYSIDLNKTLSELYFAKNDFKQAYSFLEKSTKLNDSLNSQQIKNSLAKMESQKEIDARDREIEIGQLRVEKQRTQQWYLVGGLVLLTIIGGLLFYQNRTRKRTNTTLLHLNQELDDSNKLKARFFSILNHDLRSPVSNLIHFLHLKKEGPDILSEEVKERLEQKTISAAENLLVSMEDILLWSKGQMENFKPTLKKVLVSDLFQDISNHFESQEGVKIHFENPENLDLVSDENYIKTIMRNLTGNAIKATAAVTAPTISWTAVLENNKVVLAITDNGKGAEAAQFKALYDEKETVGIKSGLGLHLIRDLAKAVNCSIELLTEEDKGTQFSLRFN